MDKLSVIFFGSTSDSVIVLDRLFSVNREPITVSIVGVVTQPARPVGRKQVITPTPVEVWAKEHGITVLNFETNKEKPWLYADENQVIDALQSFKTDLIISACYGQKITSEIIQAAKYGGLNVHPSLLPRWRGGDPVPWTILYGDRQAGVTIVRLSEKFDAGEIVAQKKINLRGDEYPNPLRTQLFEMGAEMLMEVLKDQSNRLLRYAASNAAVARNDIGNKIASPAEPDRNDTKLQPYARRLRREDGFVPWELIEIASSPAKPDPPTSPRLRGTSRNDITTTIQLNFAPLIWTALGKQFNPTSSHFAKGFAGLRGASNVTILKELMKQDYVTSSDLAIWIERAVRAFSPWPGVWTSVKIKNQKSKIKIKMEDKRVKIITAHLTTNLSIDAVQVEGKKPMQFVRFVNQRT